MGLFSKKPAPSPSDIVAELVAARMISDPQSVKFETLKFNYPFGAIWEDENTGIVVEFSNTECDGYPSSFTHNGVALSPTHQGRCKLVEAKRICHRFQRDAYLAKVKYEGDMAACAAIEQLFQKKPQIAS
jgi:hypothetical protein